MNIAFLLPCGAVALLSLLACGDGTTAAEASTTVSGPQDPAPKPLPRVRIDHETVRRLFAKDPSAEEVDNPLTPEKVALGRAIYHDTGLSKDGATSCASCHDLGKHGIDGKSAGPGGRNTPPTWNAARQFRQFWDGRMATVEELAVAHALDANGLGLADEGELVAKLKAKPELVEGFGKAFGGGEAVTTANYRLAVGAFLRSLTTRSRWDDYLGGKDQDGKDVAGNTRALTNDELFGLKAFMDVGCMTCHVGRLVGGHMYQKTGVLKPYPSKDEGRFLLTQSDADKSFFKVPSLLNVEKTGPYLHDGKVGTLEEVVKLMADIQLGKQLTDDQVRGIVAFLKALTGELPAK